jgi:hypothetical protein
MNIYWNTIYFGYILVIIGENFYLFAQNIIKNSTNIFYTFYFPITFEEGVFYMINDTILGAIYISIIDMTMLVGFLFIIGFLLKAFPIINKLSFSFRRR